MAVTQDQIRQYISSVQNDPDAAQKIAAAAQQYGVTAGDLASIYQTTPDQINSFATGAGLNPLATGVGTNVTTPINQTPNAGFTAGPAPSAQPYGRSQISDQQIRDAYGFIDAKYAGDEGAKVRALQEAAKQYGINYQDIARATGGKLEDIYGLADKYGMSRINEVAAPKQDPRYQQYQNPNQYIGRDAAPQYRAYQSKGFDANSIYDDPGYEFRRKEGEKGLERAASARGEFFSGQQGKALAQYNQDFASNEFKNAYDRYQLEDQQGYTRNLEGYQQDVGRYQFGEQNALAQNQQAYTQFAGDRAFGYQAGMDEFQIQNMLENQGYNRQQAQSTDAYNRYNANRTFDAGRYDQQQTQQYNYWNASQQAGLQREGFSTQKDIAGSNLAGQQAIANSNLQVGMASNDLARYQADYNMRRYDRMDQWGMYKDLSGMGQNAAGATGTAGAAAAGGAGNATIAGGNATAAGAINSNNAWQTGLEGANTAYNKWAGSQPASTTPAWGNWGGSYNWDN